MRKWRVYLDGVLLNDMPLGLNKFTREFVRDNELFGIYSISSFDLTFLGDGYCILKDFQDNVDSCEKEIRIDRLCQNTWTTIFTGIIEVGSVEINEELSQANVEIQDNSPLALLTRNADVTIDMQTTKDIYGGTITTGTFDTVVLDGLGGIPYNVNTIKWDEALRVLVSGITGKNTNVTSSYLNSAPTEEEWTIAFTGTLADITDISIVYRNFQGNDVLTQTFVDTGNAAITELGIRCLNELVDGVTIAEVETGLRENNDFRFFTRIDFDNPTPTILYLYSVLPMNIISVVANGSSPIGVTVTKTQDFVDKGNFPTMANYRSLVGAGSIALLQYSFKEFMTELNKAYNVFFIATYNSLDEIDINLVNYDEFINATTNLTFDNAENLVVKYNPDELFNTVSTSDGNEETLLQKERVFTSEFCGLGDSLDLRNDFIFGAVPIQTDLALPYDEGKVDNKYIIDDGGSSSIILFQYTTGMTLSVTTNFIVNKWLTNWHKIYRHLSKFRNNIIGVAGYFATSVNDYNVNITNTATNRLFRNYEFTENMTNTQFNSLSDNVIDKAQFKRTSQTTYREGLIKSVSYNYETGKAQIVILGQ